MLTDVPWRRALTIILKTQGLSYREELGVIRVAKAETLQQEEIALAVADYECTKDLPDIWEEVSKEYEAEFIREHLELLEEIRDAMDN